MNRTSLFPFIAMLWAFHAAEALGADLQTARQLSWNGEYAKAQSELDALLARSPEDSDIQLVQAYLFYYQGQYEQAEQWFSNILSAHPDYLDAEEGLRLVRRAMQADAEDYRWRLDTGYEYSHFSRSRQHNWNQQFFQLTHFLPGKNTAIYGRIERYDQFRRIDAAYELGASHRFMPRLTGYAAFAMVPEADFRPRWRVAGGGELRVDSMEEGRIPLWLTLDLRHDDYADTKVQNITPGLRVEPHPLWAVSARAITVLQEHENTTYGWLARLDGAFHEHWRFYAGYADAPETIAGVTVDTQSVFTGMAFDIDPARTVHVNYTRDDREQSFIRDVYNVSITFRF